MVIPFSCPQARGILSQLNKWPHDQYLKENEQHVQGKLNSPFSDPFLLDSTENWYLGRISESFAVGKYSWGPNGVWSSENGGYNSGRKAWVAVMDGAGAGCLPQPWWPCALTQPQSSLEARPATGVLLPEVTKVQALALPWLLCWLYRS